MYHKHALLHDHFEDEATAEPALEGHVRREDLHDIDSLALILTVQGIGQGGVEGHSATQNWKLEILSHLLLEEGIGKRPEGEDGGPNLLV